MQLKEVETGPPITKSKVEYTKCTKTGKTPGPNATQTVLLKLIEYD